MPRCAGPTHQADGLATDAKGMTLYVYAKDNPNLSICYGGCAKAWPPFYADSATKLGDGYSAITRTDGKKQWTLKDQPLYDYAGDSAPGDATGDGSGGVWAVSRVPGHSVKSSSMGY